MSETGLEPLVLKPASFGPVCSALIMLKGAHGSHRAVDGPAYQGLAVPTGLERNPGSNPLVQNPLHSLPRRKSSFWLVRARRQRVRLDAYPYDVIGRLP